MLKLRKISLMSMPDLGLSDGARTALLASATLTACRMSLLRSGMKKSLFPVED